MNIIPITVPEDIEYISEWKDFEYPIGHVIYDKTICGCGFTEYCLNNPIPLVLCSPRKKLLENKEERKHEHFLRREFSYEQFHQEFALPENADIEKISAHMEHGVLNILIPKLTPSEVKKNIRQIEIG